MAKKNKVETVQVIDGQMTVFEVLEDIEKHGLVPGRTLVAVDVARLDDREAIEWPKPLWNR